MEKVAFKHALPNLKEFPTDRLQPPDRVLPLKDCLIAATCRFVRDRLEVWDPVEGRQWTLYIGEPQGLVNYTWEYEGRVCRRDLGMLFQSQPFISIECGGGEKGQHTTHQVVYLTVVTEKFQIIQGYYLLPQNLVPPFKHRVSSLGFASEKPAWQCTVKENALEVARSPILILTTPFSYPAPNAIRCGPCPAGSSVGFILWQEGGYYAWNQLGKGVCFRPIGDTQLDRLSERPQVISLDEIQALCLVPRFVIRTLCGSI